MSRNGGETRRAADAFRVPQIGHIAIPFATATGFGLSTLSGHASMRPARGPRSAYQGDRNDSHLACWPGRRGASRCLRHDRNTDRLLRRPAAHPYTSGYYVTPIVTVREPRYYNYYSPGYYDLRGVWRTERTTY